MTLCNMSNQKRHVSDYDVAVRISNCPQCQRQLKITIPDRKMHANLARFPKHAIGAKDNKV